MGALGADSLDRAAGIDQQDLSAVDAFDLDLMLIAGGEGQGGDALKLVFLGHSSGDEMDLASAGELLEESS